MSRRSVCMLVESLTRGGSIPLTEIVLTRRPLWPERSAASCGGRGHGRPGEQFLTAGDLLRNSLWETIEPDPLSPHTNTISRQLCVVQQPTRCLAEDRVG